MSERPTPETDAVVFDDPLFANGAVCADFARKLERERDAWKENADSHEKMGLKITDLQKSSDAAHKRIHDLSIENDNLKFELAKAVQALQNYKNNG